MTRLKGAALLTAALAARAGAVAPPLVRWQDAGAHVGETVTVEGDVAAARTEGDACILEFAPGDATAFRVVLVVPLLSDLPSQPDRLYAGRRVRASGRVQRFHGRAEMVLQTPSQIVVTDVAAVPVASAPAAPASPPPAVAHAPVAPSPPPVVSPPPLSVVTSPPPAPAAAPPPTVATPPSPPAEPTPARGLVEAVQRQLPALEGCERARARWRGEAAAARDRATALTRCLDATGYDCRSEAAAVAPALSALEGAAQQVEAACP